MRRAGSLILLLVAVGALAAPWLSPNPPNRRFANLMLAPPTRIHVLNDGLEAPFIYRWRLVSRLEYRFEEARPDGVRLRWLSDGLLVAADPDAGAPLLLLGGLVFVTYDPDGLMSGFTTLPIQIFSWAQQPQAEFQQVASAAIIVMLILLLAMNAVAILIRNRYQKRW